MGLSPASSHGGSSAAAYVELEQDTFLAYPFSASTALVFDGGIVGSGGTGFALNAGQDTVTLADAGFYFITVNVHLAYSVNVTGYTLDFGGWTAQVAAVSGVSGSEYALVTAGDHYAAGATLQVVVKPNTGAGAAGGSSDFAFVSIAKVG